MNVRSSTRKVACLFFVGWVVGTLSGGGAIDALAQQVPLPGSAIPQFVDPLPLLGGPNGIETIGDGITPVTAATLSMCEFKANVMPSTFVPAVVPVVPYAGTYVWGYRYGGACPSLATALPTYTGRLLRARDPITKKTVIWVRRFVSFVWLNRPTKWTKQTR
ncbi:MAG: hypothetical protein JW395_3122 [Nitrospira sp.]|nr:hypothetical protein [Nitrospira sp.]